MRSKTYRNRSWVIIWVYHTGGGMGVVARIGWDRWQDMVGVCMAGGSVVGWKLTVVSNTRCDRRDQGITFVGHSRETEQHSKIANYYSTTHLRWSWYGIRRDQRRRGQLKQQWALDDFIYRNPATGLQMHTFHTTSWAFVPMDRLQWVNSDKNTIYTYHKSISIKFSTRTWGD